MSEGPTLHLAVDLAATAGPLLCDVIERLARGRERVRLGLAGGSTPAATFSYLLENLPEAIYPKLWVTWVDERHLPVTLGDDWATTAWPEDSNVKLAIDAWLGRAPRPACVLPMLTGADAETDLATFTERFAEDFGGAVDVLILGAGADGHIASLFEGHPAFAETKLSCVVVTESPKPPPTRLTLTLPVLERVDCAVLLASGADKAMMIARALSGDTTLPIGRYRPTGHYHWIIDPAAASRATAQGSTANAPGETT